MPGQINNNSLPVYPAYPAYSHNMHSELPPRDRFPEIDDLNHPALPTQPPSDLPAFQNQLRGPPPTLNSTNLMLDTIPDNLAGPSVSTPYSLLSAPSLMSGPDRGLGEVEEGRGMNDSILMTQPFLNQSRSVVDGDDGDE